MGTDPPFEFQHSFGLVLHGGFVKSWLLSSLSAGGRHRADGNVRTADHFASYLYSGRPDLFLKSLMNGPASPGVTEVMDVEVGRDRL